MNFATYWVEAILRCFFVILSISFGVLVAVPVIAQAQLGTGGTSGAGSLGAADIFIAVQKDKDVNQTDRERALFLNQANCQCKLPAYLKAVVLPAAAARAATVSPSATVSMYLGNYCDQTTTIGCCLHIRSAPFSQFRLTGIAAETTVDQLSRIWSTTAATCGVSSSGTGGAPVISGNGGIGGISGAEVVDGSTGGDSAGGAGGHGSSSVDTAICSSNTFGQTLWVFIGSAGDGSLDIAKASLGFTVDTEPPASPTNFRVQPADEALIANWTGVDIATAPDLRGYQILCTRADTTQVFKTGTFSPGFSSCSSNMALNQWPNSTLPSSAFACSDLLPTSSTSARIKILENGITYGMGVAAIDADGNASVIQPVYSAPVATKNFYYEYRHGDPQGASTGGFCSISDQKVNETNTAVSIGVLLLLGIIASRRFRHR